jgi:integrase
LPLLRYYFRGICEELIGCPPGVPACRSAKSIALATGRISALKRAGASKQAKSCHLVFFLLKKNGIKARIPRDQMSVIEDETAVPYTEEELEKLFEAMDAEESVRYKFFLGTGCREREVSFASWQDINWGKGEYDILRKDDVGFTPKSH